MPNANAISAVEKIVPFFPPDNSPFILYTSSLLNSRISPGWQSSTLQISSSVENRIAFALLFFRMERFAGVIPILSDSSPAEIFRFAMITSKLTKMANRTLSQNCKIFIFDDYRLLHTFFTTRGSVRRMLRQPQRAGKKIIKPDTKKCRTPQAAP